MGVYGLVIAVRRFTTRNPHLSSVTEVGVLTFCLSKFGVFRVQGDAKSVVVVVASHFLWPPSWAQYHRVKQKTLTFRKIGTTPKTMTTKIPIFPWMHF